VAWDELEQHTIEGQALGQGVSPLKRTPSNTDTLLEADGVRAMRSHLEAPSRLTSFNTLTLDWPFPQLHYSQEDGLLAFAKDAVYTVGDEGDSAALDVLEWPKWHLEDNLVQGGHPFEAAQWNLTGYSTVSDGVLFLEGWAEQDLGLVEGSTYVLDIKYYTSYAISVETAGGTYQLPIGKQSKRLVFDADVSPTLALHGTDAQVYRVSVRPFDTSPATFSVSSPWQFVDMGRYWIAISDEGCLFTHPDGNLYFIGTGGAPIAGLYHRGRVLLANTGWNWQEVSNYREALLQREYPELGDPDDSSRLFAPGPSESRAEEGAWVWWSTIGGGDVWYAMDTVSPLYSQYGSTDTDMFHLSELWQRNEAGLAKLPVGDTVLGLASIETSVLVLGSEGCALLHQHNSPTPTFGLQELDGPGIPSRGAFATSNRQVVFVRNDSTLWRYSTEGLEKLGYFRQMNSLLAEDIVVSYSQRDDEFYISDGSMTFLLTESGLTSTRQAPTSIWYDQTNLIEFDEQIAPLIETEGPVEGLYLETNIYDFGTKMQKALMYIELLTQGLDEVEVDILYTSSPTQDTWHQYDTLVVEGRGFVPVNLQFCELQISLAAVDSEVCSIDAIRLGYQLIGNRSKIGELK